MIAAAGLAIGVAIAFLSQRVLQSQLFGVHLTDASTWLAVLGAILVAAGVSAWLPAHRASRIDPAIALREE